MVVGIDGATATGKGTIAKGIGQRLGFRVLDTGAILRGMACVFIEQRLNDADKKCVRDFIKKTKVEIKFDGDDQHIFVNGVDKTTSVRTEIVSQMTSRLCLYPEFLDSKNLAVRTFASSHDCVVEGRDICTTVLPNADVKIFLQADAKTRARRRLEQLNANGEKAKFDDVYNDLLKRDERDAVRKNSPLKPTSESIIIDNTLQTVEETIEQCCRIINEKQAQKQKIT